LDNKHKLSFDFHASSSKSHWIPIQYPQEMLILDKKWMLVEIHQNQPNSDTNHPKNKGAVLSKFTQTH